jgi:nucleoside-diphosphate-sugar epimerase
VRAVVTGGAGFIGSHLVDALVGRGWRVLVIDDHSNRGSGYRNPSALYIDAAVQRAIVPDDPIDAVFHLAGKVGPSGVLRWAGQIAKDTVDAAATVGAWARRAECPLVDVSTSEVYGDPGGPNSETTTRTFQPGSSARMEYAVGKLAAETMLLNTPGLDVRIVRPFNVTGPRQMPDGGFVLPRFVAQAFAGAPLTVYQPGTQRRAFTHVSDIVAGILAVFDRGRMGEAYNLGRAANECSIAELAADVLAVSGSRAGSLIVDPATIHGPLFREAPDKIPDAGKAIRELGWTPVRSRLDIIAEVVGYWRRGEIAA